MNKEISLLICFLVLTSALTIVIAKPIEPEAKDRDEPIDPVPDEPETPERDDIRPHPPRPETPETSSGSSSSGGKRTVYVDVGMTEEQMEEINNRLDYIQAIAENPDRTEQQLRIRAGILKSCRVGETIETDVGMCNCGTNACYIVN